MASPRASSRFETPEESPGFLLWRATLSWQRRIRSGLSPHELSHTQFVLLASLWWLEDQCSREPSQARLARQAGHRFDDDEPGDPQARDTPARRASARPGGRQSAAATPDGGRPGAGGPSARRRRSHRRRLVRLPRLPPLHLRRGAPSAGRHAERRGRGGIAEFVTESVLQGPPTPCRGPPSPRRRARSCAAGRRGREPGERCADRPVLGRAHQRGLRRGVQAISGPVA
jgi:hypothetical protein